MLSPRAALAVTVAIYVYSTGIINRLTTVINISMKSAVAIYFAAADAGWPRAEEAAANVASSALRRYPVLR